MFSKLRSQLGGAVVGGLVVGAIAFGVVSTGAQANSTRNCQFESAKNVTAFTPGTEFSIKKFHATYHYECDGNSGRWTETITIHLPPVFNPGNGVLSSEAGGGDNSGPIMLR